MEVLKRELDSACASEEESGKDVAGGDAEVRDSPGSTSERIG
jgi:hypothetical protein